MTLALCVLVFVVAPLLAFAVGPWFGTRDQDEYCSRVDRDIDSDLERRIGGFRW